MSGMGSAVKGRAHRVGTGRAGRSGGALVRWLEAARARSGRGARVIGAARAMGWARVVCAVSVVGVALMASSAGAQTFSGIGVAPGMQYSSVSGISADGTTVVGSSGRPGLTPPFVGPTTMIRWRGGVLTDLGTLPGFDQGGAAAASADGSVILGTLDHTPFTGIDTAVVRWTEGGGFQTVPLPSGGFGYGVSISGDGQKVVGGYQAGPPFSFLWTAGSGSVMLPTEIREVADITLDGETIVGQWGGSAALWSEAGGVDPMGLPAGWDRSYPAEMTDDLAVCGRVERGVAVFEYVPYRWTKSGGYELLEATVEQRGQALGISEDGTLVVGTMFVDMQAQAVIWGSDGSVMTMVDYLAGFGISVSGWQLTSATAISADGLTIAGDGINPAGGQEGWVVTIPAPGSVMGLMGMAVVKKRRR